ncbi:hypothetical protein EC9_32200 [Rosistilla ulvae]|uniref:Uncharacterized protein n=1 Tax=Rosistilla ulvae TaxID=1930277 RepID=A0A517M2B3_9BACT|nr:hypothetical protein EC9_32200 [Rosistilla ulvae]
MQPQAMTKTFGGATIQLSSQLDDSTLLRIFAAVVAVTDGVNIEDLERFTCMGTRFG